MVLSNTNIEIPKSRFGSRLHFWHQTVLDSSKKHAWLFHNSAQLHTPFVQFFLNGVNPTVFGRWYADIYIYICMYVCIYVCMYVCNVCMYVCMYICIYV